MAPKKGKSGSSNKKKAPPPKGRKNGNKQSPKTELDNKLVQQSQLNPQDRVAFVRPLWENLSAADRVELLTVRVDDVVARLKQQAENAKQDASEGTESDVSLETIYERGLARLNAQETWKVWQWGAIDEPFTCAESFKKGALEKRLPEELRKLLPREEGKPTEKPAEAALRERMSALINSIHTQLQTAQDAWRRGQRAVTEGGEQTRDANIDLVISILDSLQHEHQCLYHTILTPVAEFICALVPAKNRKSTKTELFFEDFEKITPEDVAKLYEWLTEKVDALCSKLKPDPKDEDIDEDEEAVGDIDLFSLTEDKSAFTVNAKWMEHLQDRKLSEEGQPRKVKPGEDEHRVGLVLEWVYGSIVSTAEKARDGAKRPLGNWSPSVEQAYLNLLEMLKDQSEWDTRSKSAKALLKDLLSIRKRISALAKQHDVFIPGTPAAKESGALCEDLPDSVIEGVLCRESLLTQAKLHILKYERLLATNQLKTLRTDLMQSEPEFERLKRELENAKSLVRNAEKDRQRSAKVNDSLLEDQLEVQSAFREQGARLQGMYDKRQRTELEMSRREQEIKQLENWHKNVTQLLGKLQNSMEAAKAEDVATLEKVRTAFHKDFKKQLYSDADHQAFSTRIKTELKTVDKRVEDGAVVLQHLEMFLINVACDDPGAMVGTSTILPLLQERLDKKAMEFSMQKASEAMDALLKMEEEKKELKAKKELKRRSKSLTQVENRPVAEETPMEDDTADESPEKEPEEEEVKPEPVVEASVQTEPAPLGSYSLEDPDLVEQSRRYEAALLEEAHADEFQSVSNRRRGDRKKLQQNKRAYYGSPQKMHAANQRAGEEEMRRSQSGPAQPLGNKQSGAKAFANRPKSARFVSSDPRPAKTELKKANSDQPPKNPVSEDGGSVTPEAKSQKGSAAWVKGAIPPSVTMGPVKSLGSGTEPLRSASSKHSSTSEASIHVPTTPDASDVDRSLTTVKSDPVPKGASQMEHIQSELPCEAEFHELTSQSYDRTDTDPETFRGDGEQFFQMVQAMNAQDTPSQRDELTDDDRSEVASHQSDRSSDAATPEPAHVMMGPPLMPPPIGMPPHIGPIPAFHPGYYGHPGRSVMSPAGVRFPVPFHPTLSAPVTTAPTTCEPESPTASDAPTAYPYYPAQMMPHGHPLPMPPYLPVMPYGQWFAPGIPPMGGYESQVRKFPLRPTAEEFVPPSMRNDEAVSVIDEEGISESPMSEDQPSQSEDISNKHDYSTVDLPEVNDSAVAMTHTIEQTC